MPVPVKRIVIKVHSDPPREYTYTGQGMQTAARQKIDECNRGGMLFEVSKQEYRKGAWREQVS